MSVTSVGQPCLVPNCAGAIDADGFCDQCGTAVDTSASPTASSDASSKPSASKPSASGSSASRASARTSTRASRAGRTRGSRPSAPSVRRLGAGLVQVPEMVVPDPTSMVLADPQVPENKRFCRTCQHPVGRGREGRQARAKGFCVNCQQPFSFEPGLSPGDEIGPYEVAGAVAHGGQGWIYLARDRSVSDNFWVVLKGLLDAGDAGAHAAAIAERRFLAAVDHPSIVKIYTFVEHAGTGYIVMEHVGGTSLRELLKRRRAAAGRTDPLPVAEAISYLLAVLPAFAYLHRNGLVFCDFKPDNVMLGQDAVKLIDLGAVRRADDATSDVYGTPGYQAPEVGDELPSVASDIYTLGRTLASLVLDFRRNTSDYRHSLPPVADHPPLQRYDSLYRFLKKATAAEPDYRFASADEMHDELLGVLREVVAAERGTAVPAPSRRFSGDVHLTGENPDGTRVQPPWAVLPTLRVSQDDPAASTLAALPDTDPAQLVGLLSAITPATVEVRLRLARAQLEAGQRDASQYEAAVATLAQVEVDDPWDWRVDYYRGLLALTLGDAEEAFGLFDEVYDEAPGELVPKLALALAAEVVGDLPRAAVLYDVVSRTDDAFTSAAFGLARVRAAEGDRAGAAAAYRRVRLSSAAYVDAQVRLARLLGTTTSAGTPGWAGLAEASDILDGLGLDAGRRAALVRDLLTSAVELVGLGVDPPDDNVRVAGCPPSDETLRFGLERAYRDLAKLAPTSAGRWVLVDLANSVRPRTLT